MIRMKDASSERKGQFSIEYLIAFVLFSIVILYVSFEMAAVLPEILIERTSSRKDSEAQRIASLLATTNFDGGFAEEAYLWNNTRIDNFEDRCENDYYEVLGDLGLSELSGIRIIGRGENIGERYICANQPMPSDVSTGTATRFGYIEGVGLSKMEVVVW